MEVNKTRVIGCAFQLLVEGRCGNITDFASNDATWKFRSVNNKLVREISKNKARKSADFERITIITNRVHHVTLIPIWEFRTINNKPVQEISKNKTRESADLASGRNSEALFSSFLADLIEFFSNLSDKSKAVIFAFAVLATCLLVALFHQNDHNFLLCVTVLSNGKQYKSRPQIRVTVQIDETSKVIGKYAPWVKCSLEEFCIKSPRKWIFVKEGSDYVSEDTEVSDKSYKTGMILCKAVRLQAELIFRQSSM